MKCIVRALLILACLVHPNSYLSGAAILPPTVDVLPAVAVSGGRTLAALLRPLSTDDAAAVAAVATCVQWNCGPAPPSGSRHAQDQRNTTQQMQIVGLLPAVGRSSPGGAWAQIKWHGRPSPKSRPRTSQPFSMRLLQPNIYVR